MRRAALVGAPAFATSIWACGPCPPEDRIYLLRAPDAETQALIDQCRSPTNPDCTPLCTRVVGQLRGFQHCELHDDKDGYIRVHVGWQDVCPGGRRPEGFAARACRTSDGAGAWLATLAQLEAASIPAFIRLARELQAHGAPRPLVDAAAAAAGDEVVHARLCAALAWRHGARPIEPTLRDLDLIRALEAVAIENAAEGCVRETYGALLAARQARLARDPALRAAFATVAADEARHAALAWAAGAWFETMLSPAAQARVRAARSSASAELRASLKPGLPPAASATLGLPGAEDATHMLDGMRRTLLHA